ncbi:IS110 family transposase [Nonomuraea rubra]
MTHEGSGRPVIGVDTHRDSHSACLVNPVGGELAAISVTADADGYAQLLRWATEHAPGPNVVWAIEGTRSHGAGLTRALRATGQPVIESDRPKRVRRRGSGKSDALDARRAAREALGREQNTIPRAEGPREPARMLLVTRESAISAGRVLGAVGRSTSVLACCTRACGQKCVWPWDSRLGTGSGEVVRRRCAGPCNRGGSAGA